MLTRPTEWFSTWPPADDVPAFRGQGAPGRRCAVKVVATMVVLVALATLVGSLLGAETALDRSVSDWFVARRTPDWNALTKAFSHIADTLTVITIGGAVFVAGFLRKARNGLIILTIGMVGEVTMFLVITALVSRPRPDVERLDLAPPTSSFPSGHTFASAVLWGCMAIVASRSRWHPLLQRVLIVMAVVIPASVAISRLFRGMHHLTDVTASAVLAAIWLTILVRLFPLQTASVGHQVGAPDVVARVESIDETARDEMAASDGVAAGADPPVTPVTPVTAARRT